MVSSRRADLGLWGDACLRRFGGSPPSQAVPMRLVHKSVHNLVPDLLVSSLLDSSHPPAPGTPSGLLAYVCAGLVEDQSTASATSTPAASRPEHRKPRSVRGRGGASADEDTLIQAGVRLPQGTSALLLSHAPMERVPGTATVRPHRRLCIKRHSHARANISGSETSSPSVHLVFRVSTPDWCSFSFSGSGKR